ncbi:hypothetical protein [Streptomyces sp. R33]|uniref:Serine/arginine repetitive matrix protein 2 n=1 Tax=Streptomyces sp. R33 TaxID=3238629 RepID=A0AB39Y4Q4_9ACTN
MSSSDDAWWNPQSQAWEWGERPASPDAPPPEPAGRPEQPTQPEWWAQGSTPAPAPTPDTPPTEAPQPALPPLPPPPVPGYEPWSPPDPNGPGDGGRGRKWRSPLLVGLVAAVVGGASVAGWMLLGGEDGPGTNAQPPLGSGAATGGSATAGSSASAPASPAPGPSRSASPSTGSSPGYTVVHNDAGFSVSVPTGWQPSYEEQGSGSFYRPPGGDRSALLQVFPITEDRSTSSCELLRISSKSLESGTPNYRQVSLDPVAGSACELVYEYDSAESRGRRRGIERIVTAADGRRWALLAAGRAADTATVRANLTAAAESFRPG